MSRFVDAESWGAFAASVGASFTNNAVGSALIVAVTVLFIAGAFFLARYEGHQHQKRA